MGWFLVVLDLDEIFRGIGATPADARAWELANQRRPEQHGICVCGHAEGAHTQNMPPGRSKEHDGYRARSMHVCIPSKYKCPCPAYQEVLKTQDTRLFRFKTEGPEELHALSKGVEAARLQKRWVQWDLHLACINADKCGKYAIQSGVELVPVAYDRDYNESKGPTDQNVMICEICRHSVIMTWASDPSFVRVVRNEELWFGK